MYIILTPIQAERLCKRYGNYYFGAQLLTNGNYAAMETEIERYELEEIKSKLELLPKQLNVTIKQPR